MKKFTKMLLISAIYTLHANYLHAQFNEVLFTSDWIGRTNVTPNNNISAIGIGNFSSSPLSALHVNTNLLPASNVFNAGETFRTDCPGDVSTYWRMFRNGNQQGRLFNLHTDSNFRVEASQRDLIFNAGGATERMRVIGADRFFGSPIYATVHAGNVGIGTQNPLSMLHIGGDNATGAGWRQWMTVGTLYASNDGHYDNMYVGLKHIGEDINHSIVSWGNNPQGAIADRMFFLFTAAHSAGVVASGSDGIEVSRMWSNGNSVRTRFGYEWQYRNLDPQNTVHIIGDSIRGDSTTPGGNSGLRLHKTLSTTPPLTNPPTTNVLSVDENGDVILIPGNNGINNANNGCSVSSGNVVLGNDVNGTLATLTSHREIPMGDHDIVFTDPTSSPDLTKNRIGIGMTESQLSPRIRLEVRGSISLYDGVRDTNNNSNHSLFFGREQSTLIGGGAEDYGEWGIQYMAPTLVGNTYGGLNFWKPSGSDGIGKLGGGNAFLWLSDSGKVGIHTSNPVNRAEISSGIDPSVLNPVSSTFRTRSGLRFTDLNATMQPDASANSSNTVLSVNNSGDVILVNSGNGLGGRCSYNPPHIPYNWEIPLGGFSYTFSGQDYDANNNVPLNSVGIGTSNTTCLPEAKLDVLESAISNSNFEDGIPHGSIGINVLNADFFDDLNSSDEIIGVKSTVNGDETGHNRDAHHTAGKFFAANEGGTAGYSTGVEAIASDAHTNYGVSGEATGGTYNYGVYGYASSDGVDYGVYGKVWGTNDSTPKFAIYGDAGSYKYFAGYFNGNVSINGLLNVSDLRLKSNVDSIKHVKEIISKLKPRTYYFDTTNVYGLHLSNERQYGFISQDVEKVLPELVKIINKPATFDSSGKQLTKPLKYKALNYNAFIAILLQNAKEQQGVIDSLKGKINSQKENDSLKYQKLIDRLSQLEEIVNKCCSKNQVGQEKKLNIQETELNNGLAIVLDQNVPNPFNESTIISYFIPDEVNSAQLIFTDNTGKVIKTVDITTKGQGILKVYAQDLSSGIYSYTLVADGKTIDSKKMIKIK